MRKIIIIPKTGENSKLYYSDEMSIHIRHYMKINDYIRNNNLSIGERDSAYLQGIALALREYCTLIIDSNDLIIYLPLTLTKEQYDWFIKYREKIIKLNINIVSIQYTNGDYEFKHINNHNCSEKAINKLYNEIDKKLIKEKEVDIDGNKRSK